MVCELLIRTDVTRASLAVTNLLAYLGVEWDLLQAASRQFTDHAKLPGRRISKN